jgi:integrase
MISILNKINRLPIHYFVYRKIFSEYLGNIRGLFKPFQRLESKTKSSKKLKHNLSILIELEEIETRIRSIRMLLMEKDEIKSGREICDVEVKTAIKERDYIGFYENNIQEIESKKEVSLSTIKQYKSNLVLLKKFKKKTNRERDLFLFSCYTGLRFSDAQSLTEMNVKSFENNQKYLDFEMQKTSESIIIPLSEKAISIINKYSMNGNQKNRANILPQISNQKFNIHIKTIAKLSAIDKSISHHTARHTFATIALNNGIPITVVQKLLGHSSVKTTEIYAKTLTTTIFNEMEKMK